MDAATSPVIAGPAHVVSVTQVLDAPAAVLDTVGEVATDLLGSDSLLGSNGVLGIIPAVAGTVSTALGNDNPLSSILGDGTDEVWLLTRPPTATKSSTRLRVKAVFLTMSLIPERMWSLNW